MFRWHGRGGADTILAVGLLLVHQGANQGFELLDAITNPDCDVALRTWGICARESDVPCSRTSCTEVGDRIGFYVLVSGTFSADGDHPSTTCDSYRNYMTAAAVSRLRSRWRLVSTTVSSEPERVVVGVGV